MNTNEKIAAMLFSDVKGFSKIANNNLIRRFYEIIQNDVQQLLTPDNHFLVKNWGDAFFICSNSALSLAEIALQMRDKFRTRNWEKEGLPNDLAVRIALHMQEISTIENNDIFETKDVVGTDVNRTARIEPITDPNKVFCSAIFYRFIEDRHPKIRGVYVGKRSLPKNFGKQELYELVWDIELREILEEPSETPQPPTVFLSYAREDREAVIEIYKFLKSAGFSPWLDDEDIMPGDNWELTVEAAMQSADIIAICFSKKMVGKTGYIQVEMQKAVELAQKGVRIIPIKLEECNVPETFKKWQWIDWKETEDRERLVGIIKSKHGAQQSRRLKEQIANMQPVSEVRRIKIQYFEKELEVLNAQFEAAHDQMSEIIDASLRTRLRFQIERLEKKIEDVDKQLRELLGKN